jgi:cyclophilin family peptidyl-prolyl cis-trans isomerase
VLEQLLLDFPDDLQVVFRQFPLIRRLDGTPLHDKAALAAQASEAAGLQGAFWPMHNLLYARQEEWQDLSVEEFEAWLVTEASVLELDTEIFQSDLTSQFLADYAEVSYLWGVENGLPGTPYLLINGTPYTGPLDYYNLSILVELYNLEKRQFSECPPMTIDPTAEYLATIITEKGDILLRLFPDVAPMAVNSFIFLAENDWYDNVTFHRVLDWMAQSGDPTGTGVGGPGYLYDLEPWPDLLFDRPGLVAMANSGPDTNGGQFFITKAPAQWLDGNYTIFGDVIGGLDIVNSITLRDPSIDPFAPLGDLILDVTIEGP